MEWCKNVDWVVLAGVEAVLSTFYVLRCRVLTVGHREHYKTAPNPVCVETKQKKVFIEGSPLVIGK